MKEIKLKSFNDYVLNEYAKYINKNVVAINEDFSKALEEIKARVEKLKNYSRAKKSIAKLTKTKYNLKLEEIKEDDRFENEIWSEMTSAKMQEIDDTETQQLQQIGRATTPALKTKKEKIADMAQQARNSFKEDSKTKKDAEKKRHLSDIKSEIDDNTEEIKELDGLPMADWQKKSYSVTKNRLDIDEEVKFGDKLLEYKPKFAKKIMEETREREKKLAEKEAEAAADLADGIEQDLAGFGEDLEQADTSGLDPKVAATIEKGKTLVATLKTEFGEVKTKMGVWSAATSALKSGNVEDDNYDELEDAVSEAKGEVKSALKPAKGSVSKLTTWVDSSEKDDAAPEVKTLGAGLKTIAETIEDALGEFSDTLTKETPKEKK